MTDKSPQPTKASAAARVRDGVALAAKRLPPRNGAAHIGRLTLRLPHGAGPRDIARALSRALDSAEPEEAR